MGAQARPACINPLFPRTQKSCVPNMSYYKSIDGIKCDRAIVDACKKAVEGKGDGRVSVDDAKEVFAVVADGNKVTRAERWTLRFCLTEFHWTEAAQEWFKDQLKAVVQEDAENEPPAAKKAKLGTSYYETLDGVKCDRNII